MALMFSLTTAVIQTVQDGTTSQLEVTTTPLLVAVVIEALGEDMFMLHLPFSSFTN